jgi:histidyl-tRNA synthetase
VAELTEVLNLLRAHGVPEQRYALDLSIARGLDYYTGTVYETTLDEHPRLGSICSGGRYDDLAGHYTKSKLPGVGISIGATRLFYQLSEARLIGAAASTVEVLVTRFDDSRLADDLALAARLRAAGLNTEVVLEPQKLGKQIKYADRAGIRFAVVIGPDEAARDLATLKDLRANTQVQVAQSELPRILLAARSQVQTGAAP